MPRIATAVSAISTTLAAIAAPKFERAGLSEQAVDEHGERGRRGADDEERGAELAERDREGEPGGDEPRPRHDGQVDLPPDATWRGTEGGRGLA